MSSKVLTRATRHSVRVQGTVLTRPTLGVTRVRLDAVSGTARAVEATVDAIPVFGARCTNRIIYSPGIQSTRHDLQLSVLNKRKQ